MPTQKKIDTVKALSDKVSRAKALFLADYRGLKHKQLEQLRKLLKKLEAEFVVAKNRLVLRALNAAFSTPGVKEISPTGGVLTDSLRGTTAALFAYTDEVAPLKELVKFFKIAGAGKAKVGLLGVQVLSDAEVARLASLPSREVLLGQLVRQLKTPISGLHYALSWNINKLVWALNAVRGKKGAN